MEHVNTVHSVIRVGKISFILLVRYAHIVLTRFTTICIYMPYASYFVQINMTPMVFCYIPYIYIYIYVYIYIYIHMWSNFAKIYVDNVYLDDLHISSLAMSPLAAAPSAETSLYSTFSTVVDFLEMPAEALI